MFNLNIACVGFDNYLPNSNDILLIYIYTQKNILYQNMNLYDDKKEEIMI